MSADDGFTEDDNVYAREEIIRNFKSLARRLRDVETDRMLGANFRSTFDDLIMNCMSFFANGNGAFTLDQFMTIEANSVTIVKGCNTLRKNTMENTHHLEWFGSYKSLRSFCEDVIPLLEKRVQKPTDCRMCGKAKLHMAV